jgi:hypothetical protein
MNFFVVRAPSPGKIIGILAFTLSVLTASHFTPTAHAQIVTFTDVVNSLSNNSELSSFGGPAINNAGVVGFLASLSAGGQGLYTAAGSGGGGITAVALTTSPEFSAFSTPNISNSGILTFVSIRDPSSGGGVGIYTAANTSSFTTIARTQTPNSLFSNIGQPSFDDSGSLAFWASLDAGGQGIFTTSGNGIFKAIALTTDPEFASISGDSPGRNNLGIIAFMSTRDAGVGGGEGIYTTDGNGSFTTVALTSSPEFSTFNSSNPNINDSGILVFRASRDAGVGGGQGIYTTNGNGNFTTVALTTGTEFNAFSGIGPDINNLGTVAFSTQSVSGAQAIYVKQTSAATLFSVIRTGDVLFGSTVSSLTYVRGLAQGNDTLAFSYVLANGVTGIARASLSAETTAPEPSSIALLLTAGLPFVGIVWHRQSRRKN